MSGPKNGLYMWGYLQAEVGKCKPRDLSSMEYAIRKSDRRTPLSVIPYKAVNFTEPVRFSISFQILKLARASKIGYVKAEIECFACADASSPDRRDLNSIT